MPDARINARGLAAPLLAAIVTVSLARSAGAQGPADRWFGADKVKHFVAAFVVQSFTYAGLRALDAPHRGALAGATAATAAVSVWKERYDRRTTGLFSRRDLVWDGLGAAAAAVALTHTER